MYAYIYAQAVSRVVTHITADDWQFIKKSTARLKGITLPDWNPAVGRENEVPSARSVLKIIFALTKEHAYISPIPKPSDFDFRLGNRKNVNYVEECHNHSVTVDIIIWYPDFIPYDIINITTCKWKTNSSPLSSRFSLYLIIFILTWGIYIVTYNESIQTYTCGIESVLSRALSCQWGQNEYIHF